MRTIGEILQEGITLVNNGRLQEAETLLDRLLCQYPDEPNVLGILGAIYARQRKDGAAMAMLSRAVEIAEDNNMQNGGTWSNLGAVLKRHNHYDAAKQAYEMAIRLMPEEAGFYANYAGAFINMNEAHKAEELARKALSLEPFIKIEGTDTDYNLARHHLSLALLELGKWEEAWTYYDARKTTEGWQRPQYNIPTWRGEDTGTLVIHGEQGLGDEVMYCSLIPQIRDRVKRLVVEVNPRLVSLMRRSLGCEVYGSIEEIQSAGISPDHIIAMGSLPGVLNLSRKSARGPGYLVPDQTRAYYWRQKLMEMAKGKPIIGIAWTGGVAQTHKAVRNPPRHLFKSLDNGERFLVSVQYTPNASEQAKELGAYHFQPAIDDLDEQTALISALDCLVTVAQTAMHFAGGTNTPTIALISEKARWDCIGETEDQMPWWESVKVIRGEWDGVFDRLHKELGHASSSDIAAE